MNRAIYMAVLFMAATAQGQWQAWPTNWSHRMVRSNLWAALDERVNAALGDPYRATNYPFTATISPPGWWVSKGWLEAFDAMTLDLCANYYVDTSTLSTQGAPVEAGMNYSNALAAAGFPGRTNLPNQGWWFPTHTNYLERKALLNAMSNTIVNVVTWAHLGDDNNEVHYESDGHAVWLDAVADIEYSSVTNSGYAGNPVAWTYGWFDIWDEWHAEAYKAFSIPVGEKTTTNFSANASLWMKAGDYVAYVDTFDAQGESITTNWAYASEDVAVPADVLTWTNATLKMSASLSHSPNFPSPTSSFSLGYIAYGLWILDWTADTNGFKYR